MILILGESLLATKSNYDIILDRADIISISEEKKMPFSNPRSRSTKAIAHLSTHVRAPQRLSKASKHTWQPPFELHRDCRTLVHI